MADSATVRAWASQQDPPLAKADARGRFSKQLIAAFDAAHPDDVYVAAAKPTKREQVVTPPLTAATTADALRPEDSFTSPPEAVESVTGELVPDGVREAVEQAQGDTEGQVQPNRVAHILPVDPPREYESERYEETP